jgi:hypothetical protein
MKSVLGAFVVAATLALVACGGGSDSDKNLFSLWTQDGSGALLELTNARFGPDNALNSYTADGTLCICNLTVTGVQKSGTIAITGCTSTPYNSSTNAQCSAMNAVGTYTKTSEILSFTRDGTTGTFR